jgi:hypothetical protein
VGTTDDPLDWRFAFVLAVPNAGVIGVWAFTVANEWFLYTQESVPVFTLAIFGGGLAAHSGYAGRNATAAGGWPASRLTRSGS